MTALSIRHMYMTIRERETDAALRDRIAFDALPADVKAEEVHYWWIERKVIKTLKRGIKIEWKWERDLFATKKQAAEYCTRHGIKGNWRLHYRMTYGKGISK